MAANDIDCLLIEYMHGKPCALIDYKMEDSQYEDSNVEALATLANMAGLPCFVVKYQREFGWFRVMDKNAIGVETLRRHGIHYENNDNLLTERAYVSFLYALRGFTPEEEDLAGLRDTFPKKPTAEEAAAIEAEQEKWYAETFSGIKSVNSVKWGGK